MDDRRHSTVLHVAKAISVRDLHEQVSARCPDGVPIPCNEWIRLQFAPICVSSSTALRYTGRLKVRHRVQQRQRHILIMLPVSTAMRGNMLF